MTITFADVRASFLGSLPLNMKILRDHLHCVSIDLMPAKSSPLHLPDDSGNAMSLSIQLDAIMGRTTLVQQAWDPVKQKNLKKMLRGFEGDLTLVDVGANVGLFTRQCLNQIGNIRQVHCYEPNPLNFKLLTRNLGGVGRVALNNYGLSDTEGVFEFYLDPDNAGNYSLNRNAMPEGYRTTEVSIRRADAERDKWGAGIGSTEDGIAQDSPGILYKSDTQGFDETIACALDLDFWRRVRVGIFELWRLPGKNYDRDRFAQILDSFPYRIFEKHPDRNLSASEVIRYLDGVDMEFDDLYVWR